MNNCRKIELIPKDEEEIKTDDNKIIENSYNEKDNESSPEIVKPQISHSIDNIGLFFRIAPLEDDDETFFSYYIDHMGNILFAGTELLK